MGRGKGERIKNREGGKGINLRRGEGDEDRGKGQEVKSRGGERVKDRGGHKVVVSLSPSHC